MSDYESAGAFDATDVDRTDSTAPSEPERVRTDVEAVDDVIDSVDALRHRPLIEHQPVFESAHERLRRALDPADDPADDPGDDPGDDGLDHPGRPVDSNRSA